MKKLISLILALACLSALVLSAACADGGSWTCPVCGETFPASYNFCPNDSTMRPVSGGGSWPYMSLSGSGTALRSLKDESARHQSFFGPNRKNYPGAGAYKPYKVSRATALFREGDYVLVDMSYTTVGRRCVYFRASSLTNASVQAVTLSGHSARVTSRVQPHFGPGYEYDEVDRTVTNRKTGRNTTEKVMVDAGSRITVFFECSGWVFAEFGSSLGTIRAWIPADDVD